MPIGKKPTRNQDDTAPKINKEQAEKAFIAGAGATLAEPEEANGKRIPVMMRFDPDLLSDVDKAAKKRGISRNAWIQFVVSRALEQGEG